MPSDWRVVRVEDIAAHQPSAMATGPFGSSISAKYFTDYGVPVIRGSNLSADVSTRLIDDGLAFISPNKAKEFRRSVARRGDLVFTCWGTINQVGLIDATSRYEQYIVSNKQMKLTLDPTKADVRFIYYVFSSPEKQSEILGNGIGSSVPGFNLGQLRAHEIQLPPLPVQVSIAAFLKLLDDRIDLLRQTNATLESIAQALFKSWFIDFDPVRAKAQGREPEGMDAATAALFPAEFAESALGAIPKGWSCNRLGDLLELLYGKALKATDRRDGPIPVYGSGGVTGNHDEALVQQGSVIVGRKGTVGSLYWEDGPFYPIDTTFYVRPISAPLTYCYYAMQRLGLENMNTDAAVPGLNRENAYRLEIVLPPASLLTAFDEMARALRNSMHMNVQRTKSLARLRDTLLPRLISGKLRLPETETQLEKAVA